MWNEDKLHVYENALWGQYLGGGQGAEGEIIWENLTASSEWEMAWLKHRYRPNAEGFSKTQMWASTRKSRSTVTSTPSSYISGAPFRYGVVTERSRPAKRPAFIETMSTPRSMASAHAVFSASVFARACHSCHWQRIELSIANILQGIFVRDKGHKFKTQPNPNQYQKS